MRACARHFLQRHDRPPARRAVRRPLAHESQADQPGVKRQRPVQAATFNVTVPNSVAGSSAAAHTPAPHCTCLNHPSYSPIRNDRSRSPVSRSRNQRSNLRRELLAGSITRQDAHILWASRTQLQLHGAGDLRLLEYASLAHLGCRAVEAQDRNANGIESDAISAGQDYTRSDNFPPIRTSVGEGLDPIHDDKRRRAGAIDLGNPVR
jgi:hypothetical protein